MVLNKAAWGLSMAVGLAVSWPLSAWAQEAGEAAAAEPAAETAAESAPDSAAPESAPPEQAQSEPQQELDTIPVDTPSEAAESDAEPWLIFGLERSEATLDLSDENLKLAFGSGHLDGGFYRARVGAHLLPGISAEAQFGFVPDDDKATHDLKVDHFYAAYLVTTGSVLDTLEISARVGYAWVGAEHGAFSENFDDVSYGVGVDLPFRRLSASLPDIRLSLAGTVYSQGKDARYYGWSYGLRYDF